MKKNYIFDTNVLIHDPNSIFKFQENNIYIPIYVLEELDKLKNDHSERGFSVREAVRRLDELRTSGKLSEGVELEEGGKLTVYSLGEKAELLSGLTNLVDNSILQTALSIKESSDLRTILVTMDINMRVRAEALGLQVASYESQSVNINEINNDIKKISLSPEGINDFFSSKRPIDLKDYEVDTTNLVENDPIMAGDGSSTALGVYNNGSMRPLITPREGILGVRPKNKEQAFAFDFLLNEDIKLVSLMGVAGGGKTLLSCCVGLFLVLEERYDKLLISRPVVPLGRDLGFLPGDLHSKIDPYMSPFYDNLDYIMMSSGMGRKYNTSFEKLMEDGKIQIEPLTYIRGRSIASSFIIVDESSNTTPHEIKTIISRCGENTKIVLTGDPEQIDNPYVDSSSNGLSVVAKKMIDEPEVAHLRLRKGLRSTLANIAIEKL